MNALLHHLPVLPIVLPLICGALLLLLPQSRTVLRSSISLLTTLAQAAIAAYLLYRLIYPQPGLLEHGVEVYVLGGWVAPYGIVLVVDRLSALMLALNAAIALPVLVYSLASWDRIGVHYHSMVQFLLMGLNGAFLTGDLFNLFVFFEILLSASYGLLLHGSNSVRVKA
ncbi:MAG TPA: monovalent cation/H+ antiporter subunit D, partial [Steroidobacter sp.]